MGSEAFDEHLHDLLVSGDKEQADEAFRVYMGIDSAIDYFTSQRDILLAVSEIMENPDMWADAEDFRRALAFARAIRLAIGA